MADNFNDNSLSDMLGDPTWDFSEMKGNDSESESTLQRLNEQIQAARREQSVLVKDSAEWLKIEKKIRSLQGQIAVREQQSSKQSRYDTKKSLFDKSAFIDYGRYVRNGDWNEYNKDSTGAYAPNNDHAINEPIPGDGEVNISPDGLSVHELIRWSENYPALQLRFQDFVYCKHLGTLPNNRLIILRRFKNGVPDNLFNYHQQKLESPTASTYLQPLSTMVSWLRPEENFISFNFNENWKTQNGDIFSLVSEIGSKKRGECQGR